MRPRNLAPNDPNLSASDLLLAAVDVCDALAQVEGCRLRVVNALDLNERSAWVGGMLGALVRQVLAPTNGVMLVCCNESSSVGRWSELEMCSTVGLCATYLTYRR